MENKSKNAKAHDQGARTSVCRVADGHACRVADGRAIRMAGCGRVTDSHLVTPQMATAHQFDSFLAFVTARKTKMYVACGAQKLLDSM